jgi:hypothetical protein
MNINQFPNPKINLSKEFRDSKDKATIIIFKAISDYILAVGKYIYTDIKLLHQPSDPNHVHAWIQRTVSAIVLRSLYLRNSFVDSINSRNGVGMFLPLKSWLESAAVLAYILDLLEKKLPQEDLLNAICPIALGNRGNGDLRVGTVDAINVMTMLEKADKYLTKLQASKMNGKDKNNPGAFFKDFYDVVSNSSHPSFDAYEIIGTLSPGSDLWICKDPDAVKRDILESLLGYGGLLMTPLFVNSICSKIFDIEKPNFEQLDSNKYFD